LQCYDYLSKSGKRYKSEITKCHTWRQWEFNGMLQFNSLLGWEI